MTKMNPEIKAKWVAALRSGVYPQGDGYLRSDDGRFCCIGVLCDIVAPAEWINCGEDCAWDFAREGHEDLPPSEWRAKLGIDWDRVKVQINGINDTLVSHNDGGRTFAQIADAIEAQL